MVAHVVRVLRETVDEVVVVASGTLELPPLDARVVRDREPGLGPLAGIREGLASIRAEFAFVTATDAPFLTPAFARTLLACGGAAAPVVDGQLQPLATVYPRAALRIAERLLEAGKRRALDLLEATDYRTLDETELSDLDSARGLDTPDAYLDAVRSLGPATATLELSGRARRAAGRGRVEGVPVGTLAEVFAHAGRGAELLRDGRVAAEYRVLLEGRCLVRHAGVPIGPGERVRVQDAPAER